ncbi:MAG: hypothetical protein V3V08_11610 [Nannocystaceae bacterium]
MDGPQRHALAVFRQTYFPIPHHHSPFTIHHSPFTITITITINININIKINIAILRAPTREGKCQRASTAAAREHVWRYGLPSAVLFKSASEPLTYRAPHVPRPSGAPDGLCAPRYARSLFGIATGLASPISLRHQDCVRSFERPRGAYVDSTHFALVLQSK